MFECSVLADGTRLINFVGDITIYAVSDLKPLLLELLSTQGALSLDLSGVQEMDGAGLQLMISFVRACASSGNAVSINGCSESASKTINFSSAEGLIKIMN